MKKIGMYLVGLICFLPSVYGQEVTVAPDRMAVVSGARIDALKALIAAQGNLIAQMRACAQSRQILSASGTCVNAAVSPTVVVQNFNEAFNVPMTRYCPAGHLNVFSQSLEEPSGRAQCDVTVENDSSTLTGRSYHGGCGVASQGDTHYRHMMVCVKF